MKGSKCVLVVSSHQLQLGARREFERKVELILVQALWVVNPQDATQPTSMHVWHATGQLVLYLAMEEFHIHHSLGKLALHQVNLLFQSLLLLLLVAFTFRFLTAILRSFCSWVSDFVALIRTARVIEIAADLNYHLKLVLKIIHATIGEVEDVPARFPKISQAPLNLGLHFAQTCTPFHVDSSFVWRGYFANLSIFLFYPKTRKILHDLLAPVLNQFPRRRDWFALLKDESLALEIT